jgi:hypothetical protein
MILSPRSVVQIHDRKVGPQLVEDRVVRHVLAADVAHAAAQVTGGDDAGARRMPRISLRTPSESEPWMGGVGGIGVGWGGVFWGRKGHPRGRWRRRQRSVARATNASKASGGSVQARTSATNAARAVVSAPGSQRHACRPARMAGTATSGNTSS